LQRVKSFPIVAEDIVEVEEAETKPKKVSPAWTWTPSAARECYHSGTHYIYIMHTLAASDGCNYM
jgi:hypothetical protein